MTSTIVELSWTFFCFSFIFSVAIFIMVLNKPQRKSNKKATSLPLPPGPKPWPVLGSLPELLKNKPTFRWIHKLMDEMNAEIICIRLGNTHVIPVTSPEIACEFLKQQDPTFSSRPICLSAEILSGGYLTTAVTPFGDQWKKMRKIFLSDIVSSTRHRWLQGKRDKESNHLVSFMYNKCNIKGGLVNVRTVSRHYCANIMRRIVFGKRFFGKGAQDGGPGLEEEEHVKGTFIALHYLYSFCISDYVPFFRGYLNLDGHEKIMRAACTSVRKYQDPIVDERIRQWRDGEKNEHDDILDVLVTLKDANGDSLLRSEEIKAQLVELMVEIVDNPSNTVEWALAEILNQPKILKIAMEELDRVVGKSRLVQESDIPQLNFLKACIKESFRIHPINPFNVPHLSDSDTFVAGYFIPKGSHVILSRPGLGRNSRVWPEPFLFRPDRHLGGGDVSLVDHDLRILSFSTGRRSCVGFMLGSTMTMMLLARMLQGFNYSFPPGITMIDLKESSSNMELDKPLVVIAEPRLDKKLYLEL